MNAKVEPYFKSLTKWQDEIRKLREIILTFPLIEELKWAKPFYSINDGNVLVIWGFKEHCALGFCKGALLKDPHQILVKPGENTQAVRKIPFTSLEEIVKLEPILKSYIHEAIEVEKAGLEVDYKKPSEFVIPQELQKELKSDPALKTAFFKLTPGRQRGYIIYVSGTKQPQTQRSRIAKCRPDILAGKGLNDREKRSAKTV